MASIGDLNHYAREQAAWTVGSSIAQALGMKSYAPHGGGAEYQVWNKGWKAADVQTLRSKGIGNILNNLYAILRREKKETLTDLVKIQGLGGDGPSLFALDLLSRLGMHVEERIVFII